MVIAVDYDGTCTVTNVYPHLGTLRPHCIEVLKALQAAGHKLILWTCRSDDEEIDALSQVVEMFKAQGFTFDAVNDNLPEVKEHYKGLSRKIFATYYIDDAAWPGLVAKDTELWEHVAASFGIVLGGDNDSK